MNVGIQKTAVFFFLTLKIPCNVTVAAQDIFLSTSYVLKQDTHLT